MGSLRTWSFLYSCSMANPLQSRMMSENRIDWIWYVLQGLHTPEHRVDDRYWTEPSYLSPAPWWWPTPCSYQGSQEGIRYWNWYRYLGYWFRGVSLLFVGRVDSACLVANHVCTVNILMQKSLVITVSLAYKFECNRRCIGNDLSAIQPSWYFPCVFLCLSSAF